MRERESDEREACPVATMKIRNQRRRNGKKRVRPTEGERGVAPNPRRIRHHLAALYSDTLTLTDH